jgi:hypothetical protein
MVFFSITNINQHVVKTFILNLFLFENVRLANIKRANSIEDFQVNQLKFAESFSLTKVLGNDSVLQEEQVIPLRRAVVLGLGSPEEPEKFKFRNY